MISRAALCIRNAAVDVILVVVDGKKRSL